MGEGLDNVDPLLMPHIDIACVACGGHTGDLTSMQKTIELALASSVSIGAHPSYPDRKNFGRKPMAMSPDHLFNAISEQLENLQSCAEGLGTEVTYIKAHGALYHECVTYPDTMHILLSVARTNKLKLITQASSKQQKSEPLLFEAFADRSYTMHGTLLNRKFENAVHDNVEKSIKQAKDLCTKKGLFSIDGQWLPIAADTLCVHSDSPNSVATTRAIRQMIG